MTARLELPGGQVLELLPPWPRPVDPAPRSRLAFAALHLVLDGDFAAIEGERARDPAVLAAHLDWDATLDLRRRVDRQGLGVAEAMDTAQRFEIGWDLARALIERTGQLGLSNGFVAGASADHLPTVGSRSELAEAVAFQARVIRAAGGWPVLLPQPWLVSQGTDEAGYVDYHARVLDACEGPVLLHWLGEMFHPGLAGYFPGNSFERVMALDPRKVRGAKLSLLDADLERRLRRTLLEHEQILLTGDDWNFAPLIAGAPDRIVPPSGTTLVGTRTVPLGDFSHALLGILDATALPTGVALDHLARGDHRAWFDIMAPCQDLGRHLFEPPVPCYKAGLAFLAWLDGRQDTFLLPAHLERTRDRSHLLRAAALAARARCFERPESVQERLARFVAGG